MKFCFYTKTMKKFFKELIFNILINAILLFIISAFVPELWFKIISSNHNAILTFFILGAIFRFLNMVVKKILKFITLPLKYLTLWLSSMLINILIFYIFEITLRSLDMGILIQLGGVLQVLVLSLIITGVYLLVKKLI